MAVVVRAVVAARGLGRAKTDVAARASAPVQVRRPHRCNSSNSPASAAQQKCKPWVVVNAHRATKSGAVPMAKSTVTSHRAIAATVSETQAMAPTAVAAAPQVVVATAIAAADAAVEVALMRETARTQGTQATPKLAAMLQPVVATATGVGVVVVAGRVRRMRSVPKARHRSRRQCRISNRE